MENKWKLVIITAFCLSIISVFISGLQVLRTTPTNRVYLETEIIQIGEASNIIVSNPYDFEVFDIYVLYKFEPTENYYARHREMLGRNESWNVQALAPVVDAYAYGVKP